MIKISRESEVNLINVLIDQDVISGKDLPNIKKLSSEGEKTQLEAVFDLKLTDEDKILCVNPATNEYVIYQASIEKSDNYKKMKMLVEYLYEEKKYLIYQIK